MGDVFKEQIVKKKTTGKDTAIRAGLVLAVIMVFFISSLFDVLRGFSFILVVAAGFGAYLLMNRLNIEYEYIFTNGELDIDIIYNRSKRKRLLNVVVAEIEIMAHVEDKNHMGAFKSANETRDYSSGTVTNDTYAFLILATGKRLKIVFEPNDMMIKAISTVLTPRKLHKKV